MNKKREWEPPPRESYNPQDGRVRRIGEDKPANDGDTDENFVLYLGGEKKLYFELRVDSGSDISVISKNLGKEQTKYSLLRPKIIQNSILLWI